MNRYEIFIMMFFCLDAYWDDNKTDSLGDLCSDLNPFLFKGIGSADPAYWAEFCKLYPEKQYSISEGYTTAKEYVKRLDNAEATKAMNFYSLEKWEKAYNKYKEQSA